MWPEDVDIVFCQDLLTSFVPMVTSHQRKRPNGVGIAGFNFLDQQRTKKKKSELQKNNLNGKSVISLELDGNHRKVVAQREQVGISRRDMVPFIHPASMHHGDLADIFTVPQQVLELGTLAGALPYQVWQTHLSRKEKKFLMQFLPEGQDAEEVVQKLLSGDNFHFGNPLSKWTASLCSGNLHPDSVLQQERSLKYHKKAYYIELQNYHKGMIQYLQNLKDAWEITSVPEKKISAKIWRSRKDSERRISLPECAEPEYNVLATSESHSLVGEAKACSSDNQNSNVIKGRKFSKRKGSMKEKSRKLMDSSNDVIPQSDKLQNCNMDHSDCTQYMSYLKISKKQLEMVKSMKQAGRSIQITSLNSVLGNVDTLHVQPYEEFVKEERMKLQEHWLQLVIKELATAYTNWEERKFQKQERAKVLDQEMKERVNSREEMETADQEIVFQNQVDQELSKHDSIVMGEKKGSHKTFLLDKNDQGERNCGSILVDNEHSGSDSLQSLSPRQISSLSGGYDPNLAGINSEINQSPQNHNPHNVSFLGGGGGGHNLNPVDINSENNPSPEQISSLSGGYGLNPMDINSENNHVESKSDGTSHLSVNSGNGNSVDDSSSQGVPITSGGDVWSVVSMPNSFDDSTAALDYPSTRRLHLMHQVNEEQESQMIDLEAHVPEHGAVQYLSYRQSDDGSFGAYQNHSFSDHDRSGLLQSLFNSRGMLSYNHEQKQMGLDIQPQSNMMMENVLLPRHLQGQLHVSLQLQDVQKRPNEDCLLQNLTDVYSEEGGYVTPARGNIPPINMQELNTNPSRMSEQLQSHLNDDRLLTHNWYSKEHHVRDGWSGLGAANVPSQSGGCNADQGLFTVLSHCNQLNSSSTYESMRCNEQQLVVPRNYGMGSRGIPRMDNGLPPIAHPVDYLSVLNPSNSVVPDDMGWINLPQNSTVHDTIYLRSWNQ